MKMASHRRTRGVVWMVERDGREMRGGQAVIIEAIRVETAFGQRDMQQFRRSSADKTVR